MELFRIEANLPKEQFLLELEKRQLAASPGSASELNVTEPTVHQQREPRIAVSQPVQVWGQDDQESSGQTSLIEVSHRGARIGGVALPPKVGEVVHLISDGIEERFRVIWVGELGTAREGQIGLQIVKTDN